MNEQEGEDTGDREIVNEKGSGGVVERAPARAATPSTADAIGRELIAIRSILLGALACTDAALTNFRMLQIQNDTVDALTGDVDSEMSLRPLDKISALARRQKDSESAVPRTFGDGRRRATNANSEEGTNANG